MFEYKNIIPGVLSSGLGRERTLAENERLVHGSTYLDSASCFMRPGAYNAKLVIEDLRNRHFELMSQPRYGSTSGRHYHYAYSQMLGLIQVGANSDAHIDPARARLVLTMLESAYKVVRMEKAKQEGKGLLYSEKDLCPGEWEHLVAPIISMINSFRAVDQIREPRLPNLDS